MTLNECIIVQNLSDLGARLHPVMIQFPISSAKDMLQSVHGRKFSCNVATWCLMIAEDGAHSKNGIEAFKYFCGVTNCETKSADVLDNVRQYLKLHLDDDLRRIYQRKGIKDVPNENIEILL